MTNAEQLKQSILTMIDREVKISKILDMEVDQEFIIGLEKQFQEILEKELNKYE